MNARLFITAGAIALALGGCSKAIISPDKQIGPNPVLPAPHQFLLPPMGIAHPVGWKNGAMPSVPAGFTIAPFASDLKSPRRVLGLPNGDVLVVESGGPGLDGVSRPKDIVFGIVIGKAHGPGKPGNEVVLLRDTDGDGKADMRKVLADKLDSPFGIVVHGGYLYVAETGAILRWPYNPGDTALGPKVRLADLPKGAIDHHWTKDLAISPDGSMLYAGVGSNSNIVENGLEAEEGRAAIWQVHAEDGAKRLYATGLRNPNGLTFNPTSGQLWAVVNERDELGNDLVPDYMTSVKPGAFYGWPWSYYGQHVDKRVHPGRPDMVAKAIPPDYALSSHVAALGLIFENGSGFPAAYKGGAFVGEHGSWDRQVPNGYRVVFVPFAGGTPAGKAQVFVGGFIGKGHDTFGRPVGLSFDSTGALLVADDVGNVIWRVTANAPAVAAKPAAVPAPKAG
ncbi:MAG: sorbosone dehydrogenase family protein [Croceibacterium sp.]